jgi:hypothetical protein
VASPQRSRQVFLAGEMTGCCGSLPTKDGKRPRGPSTPGPHPDRGRWKDTRSTGPMANPQDAGQGHLTTDLARNVHDADSVTHQQMSGPDAGGLTGAAHLSCGSRVAPEGAIADLLA